MSSDQRFFESDDDYQRRIAQEADEHTIESISGHAPSQRFFENNDDYRDRLTNEANEYRIEQVTGTSPSQRFFESDDGYRDRIEQEANEQAVESLTDSLPSQGFFESDQEYSVRVRREANESIVERGEGKSPRQGLFEGDHDYRSRVAHEARIVRAQEQSNIGSYSSHDNAIAEEQSTSDSGSVFFKLVIGVIVIGTVFNWFGSKLDRTYSDSASIENDEIVNVPPQELVLEKWTQTSIENYNGYVRFENGKGWLEVISGDVNYDGQVLNNQPHGIGTLTWSDGSRYLGGFINGKMSGHGTYRRSNDEVIEYEYIEGTNKGFLILSDLGKYEGEINGFIPHGQGKFVSSEKILYEGAWRNGCFNDDSLRTSIITAIETCGFQPIQKSYRGFVKYEGGEYWLTRAASGDVHYDGQVLMDQPHGKGILVVLNDYRYEGEFVSGKICGKGVFIWLTGDRMESNYCP